MKVLSLAPKRTFRSISASFFLALVLATTMVTSAFTVSKPHRLNAHLLRVERKGAALLYYFRINIPNGYADFSAKGTNSSGTITNFVGARVSETYFASGSASGTYTSNGNGAFNISVTYSIPGYGTNGYNGTPAIVSTGPIGND